MERVRIADSVITKLDTNNYNTKGESSMQFIQSQPVTYTINASAVTSSAASFFGWLPPTLATIASFLSIVWLLVQLHDSRAFSRLCAWIKRSRSKK